MHLNYFVLIVRTIQILPLLSKTVLLVQTNFLMQAKASLAVLLMELKLLMITLFQLH